MSIDLESKALEVISKAEETGVFQSDLWRELGIGSKKGSRLVLKLVKKGLIRRERVLHEHRWTYRLFPIKKPLLLESIIDCPCFACPVIDQCGAGTTFSPETCKKLTSWLTALRGKAKVV